MTGLDEVRDELIEVAAVITDFDLNPLDEGIDIVIKPSAAALENMNDFVTKMHTSSGLITELDAGTTVAEAQTQVLEYIKKHVPEAGKAPLGGNSVGTDKVFLNKQMPELVEHLHYRIIDVSSIKELSKQWFPAPTSSRLRSTVVTAHSATSSTRSSSSSTTARPSSRLRARPRKRRSPSPPR